MQNDSYFYEVIFYSVMKDERQHFFIKIYTSFYSFVSGQILLCVKNTDGDK